MNDAKLTSTATRCQPLPGWTRITWPASVPTALSIKQQHDVAADGLHWQTTIKHTLIPGLFSASRAPPKTCVKRGSDIFKRCSGVNDVLSGEVQSHMVHYAKQPQLFSPCALYIPHRHCAYITGRASYTQTYWDSATLLWQIAIMPARGAYRGARIIQAAQTSVKG